VFIEVYIFLIGLLWLALVLSVYWGIKLSKHKTPCKLLLISLIIFSPITRIPVVILWWVTKTFEIGTHYDMWDNWSQVLLGQLLYMPLIQIFLGFILGVLVITMVKPANRKSEDLTI
jgi:hypothetical protein